MSAVEWQPSAGGGLGLDWVLDITATGGTTQMFFGTQFPFDSSAPSKADALSVAEAIQAAVEGLSDVTACALTPVIVSAAAGTPPTPRWQVTGGVTSESGPVIHLTEAETGDATEGLTILLITRSGDETEGITGITDNLGSTWARLSTGYSTGEANTCIECWTSNGNVTSSGTMTTVTIASPAAQDWSWNLHFWPLFPFTSRVDTASSDGSSASGTTIDTPSVAPTYPGDLVIAAGSWPQESAVLDSAGWTALDNFDTGSAQSGRAAYVWPNDTAGLNAEWTLGASQPAGVLTVALLGPNPAAPQLTLPSSDWAFYTAALTTTPEPYSLASYAFLVTRSPADGILTSADITSVVATFQSALAALSTVTACSVAQTTVSPASV